MFLEVGGWVGGPLKTFLTSKETLDHRAIIYLWIGLCKVKLHSSLSKDETNTEEGLKAAEVLKPGFSYFCTSCESDNCPKAVGTRQGARNAAL